MIGDRPETPKNRRRSSRAALLRSFSLGRSGSALDFDPGGLLTRLLRPLRGASGRDLGREGAADTELDAGDRAEASAPNAGQGGADGQGGAVSGADLGSEGSGRPRAVSIAGLHWSRIAGTVAAIVVLGLGVIIARSWDSYNVRAQHLRIRKVEVIGARNASIEAIVAASGHRPGGHLLDVRELDVATRVMALSWIRSAEVRARVPDTLEIRVVEHEPVAILADGPLWLLDANGVAFRVFEAGDPLDLPLLSGIPVEDLAPVPVPPPASGPEEGSATPQVATAQSAQSKAAAEARRVVAARHEERQWRARQLVRRLVDLAAAIAASPLVRNFPLGELAWDQVLGISAISASDGAELRFGRRDVEDRGRLLADAARIVATVKARGERLRYALFDTDGEARRVVVATEPMGPTAAQPVGGPAAAAPPPQPDVGPDGFGLLPPPLAAALAAAPAAAIAPGATAPSAPASPTVPAAPAGAGSAAPPTPPHHPVAAPAAAPHATR